MKQQKNKGITLVALVVTIVVLLILAGITITMLFSDSGIITKAREAAEATEKAQSDTEKGLENLAEELAVASGEYDWKLSEDGKTVSNKNYPQGIEVGSYVKYNCTPVDGSGDSYDSTSDKSGYDKTQTFTTEYYKNKDWRVLGVDSKGHLLLISDESVNNNDYYLEGIKEYENGIEELNKICDLYGHGKGATGGRMLTIEEIDKMTGLNGNNIDGNGKKYNEGLISEYGNKITYYWNGAEQPYYEYTNSKETKSGNLTGTYTNGFTYYDESTRQFTTSQKPDNASTGNKQKITTITSTHYYYNVTSSTDMQTKNPKLYETLFNGDNYWLSSVAVQIRDSGDAYWGIGWVDSDDVYSIGNIAVSSNGDDNYNNINKVRPIISLKTNIKLEVNETEPEKNGCKVYDVK